MRPSLCQAFTLIELLVILVIVAILALVGIPSFNQFIRIQRVTGETESLHSALDFARAQAIKSNQTVYLSFMTGDNWCYGVNAGSTCSCNVANSCSLLNAQAPVSQQLSLSTTGFINSVSFESTHGAANTSGTLTFTAYGQTELITLSIGRLGNIQACSTGIGGYTGC